MRQVAVSLFYNATPPKELENMDPLLTQVRGPLFKCPPILRSTLELKMVGKEEMTRVDQPLTYQLQALFWRLQVAGVLEYKARPFSCTLALI